MSLDDARLVQRCLRDDAEASRELVARFQGDVFGLCLRLLGDAHEAEDVAQEVFLRVFRSLRRWDSQRPLRPWIMGIAVNRCRTHLGQRRRRPEPTAYVPESAPRAVDNDPGELLREIDAAVDRLRPDYREVFVLYHDRGLEYAAIAEALNRPVGTIKTWLHRARQEVLDHLRRRGLVSEVGHELS